MKQKEVKKSTETWNTWTGMKENKQGNAQNKK